eukprot:TRINITY_DN66793_c11_g2_i6.p1 TRINITY_DN66793_c11_g2~~TRINITY_DN66793_c11_g2_i6.p1  ORF type:complete len:193 (-),score=8.88 TRINITY_DN66793_c11_g2_i6:225-803(-)
MGINESILVLGANGAGKTTFLRQIKDENQKLKQKWDGAYVTTMYSAERHWAMWPAGPRPRRASTYFEKALGVVWVVDSANTASVEQSANLLQATLGDAALSSTVPLLILANKQDVEGALTPQDVAKKLGIDVHHMERPCWVQGTQNTRARGLSPSLSWILSATEQPPGWMASLWEAWTEDGMLCPARQPSPT